MMDLLERVRRQRVLPVLRLPSASEAVAAAAAMITAGFDVVELTATTQGWSEAIREARSASPANTLIGLGTVTDAHAARTAVDAGAAFLVSPWPAPAVRVVAESARVPFIEGAFSPGELAAAAARGPVKMFPAHVGGPAMLRSVRQLLPDAVVVPTGGIRFDEVADWLAAGAHAVGVGNDLLRDDALPRLRSVLRQLDEQAAER
jgi:2-dehydro-3-deoxyphosphogluconate aldolase/(4S)-4-hydroxy-2-oxoglutarate aldolase